jgi:mono/diheme cytochrome c family protein
MRVNHVRGVTWAVGVLALFAAAGCGEPPGYPTSLAYPPRTDLLVEQVPADPPPGPDDQGQIDAGIALMVRRGGKALDPAQLADGQKTQLRQALVDLFGTPAAPAVTGDADIRAAASRLQLEPERLTEGSRTYRRLCLHCHGLSGDGRGTTGPWILPHPRDYRRGAFKFVSTAGTGPRLASRVDLARTLRAGLPGSAMPAFDLLPEDQLQQVIGYVMHLSLRGQVEAALLRTLLTEGDPADFAAEARAELTKRLNQWEQAEVEMLSPAEPPGSEDDFASPDHQESVRRGYRLFSDGTGPAACTTCHADFGRQAKARYDIWGTQVKPANLTDKVYRGGGRPADLYCRVRGGIGPSGMPAASALSEAQVWDVVRFVRALPYPARLPDDVRAKVYPEQVAAGGR